jgi:hypothetical protein
LHEELGNKKPILARRFLLYPLEDTNQNGRFLKGLVLSLPDEEDLFFVGLGI